MSSQKNSLQQIFAMTNLLKYQNLSITSKAKSMKYTVFFLLNMLQVVKSIAAKVFLLLLFSECEKGTCVQEKEVKHCEHMVEYLCVTRVPLFS